MLSLFILLFIVLAALVLFIGGWVSADLVGIMVLVALALTGLVSRMRPWPGSAVRQS